MSTADEIKLIQPLPVRRDMHGWWSHPGIPDFDEDHERWKAWIRQQWLETTFKLLQDEPETNPVYAAYFEKGGSDVSAWTPPAPDGEDWFTLSIHDTEDGPVWVWARRVDPTAHLRPDPGKGAPKPEGHNPVA